VRADDGGSESFRTPLSIIAGNSALNRDRHTKSTAFIQMNEALLGLTSQHCETPAARLLRTPTPRDVVLLTPVAVLRLSIASARLVNILAMQLFAPSRPNTQSCRPPIFVCKQ